MHGKEGKQVIFWGVSTIRVYTGYYGSCLVFLIFIGGKKDEKIEKKILIKSSVKALLLEVLPHLHHSSFQIGN